MTGGIGTILNGSSRDLNYLLQANGSMLLIKFIAIFYIFLWIISIIRVAKDISSRSNNTFGQLISILGITLLSPILGLPLYIILRPIHHKHDRIPRREAEALNILHCYNCLSFNLKENEFCTHCGEPLKIQCKQCANTCPYHYRYCNECGSPNFDN